MLQSYEKARTIQNKKHFFCFFVERKFATPHFYVAIQIIGKYLLFINCYISNSYTISREYDDFWGSRSRQPIMFVTGTMWLSTTDLPDKLLLVDTDSVRTTVYFFRIYSKTQQTQTRGHQLCGTSVWPRSRLVKLSDNLYIFIHPIGMAHTACHF